MADPDFSPRGGRTKEESAWAVCQAQIGDKKSVDLEDNTMTEEIKKEENVEQLKGETKEEIEKVEEAPESKEEEVKEEEQPKEEEKKDDIAEEAQKIVEENKSLNEEVKVLKSKLEDLEKKNSEAVLKASVEEPVNKEVDDGPLTIEKMLKLKYSN